MPRESSTVKAILGYLRSLPECEVEKTHVCIYSTKGKVDLSGCIAGRRFEIEVKRDGEDPTLAQRQYMKRWARAGAITGVARSVDDVKMILCKAISTPSVGLSAREIAKK